MQVFTHLIYYTGLRVKRCCSKSRASDTSCQNTMAKNWKVRQHKCEKGRVACILIDKKFSARLCLIRKKSKQCWEPLERSHFMAALAISYNTTTPTMPVNNLRIAIFIPMLLMYLYLQEISNYPDSLQCQHQVCGTFITKRDVHCSEVGVKGGVDAPLSVSHSTEGGKLGGLVAKLTSGSFDLF